MNQPITIQSDLSLEVAAAQTTLDRLREEADDLQAESERLAKVFKVEPSEEVFAKKSVAQQKAQNAREAVAAQESVLQTAAEAVRRAERNAVSLSIADKERAITARFAKAFELIGQGIEELDAAIADMAAHHGARLAAERQGAGLHPFSLQAILSGINRRLTRFDAKSMHERQHTGCQLHLGLDHTREANVVLHVQRPAGHVPNPLH